MAQSKMGGMKQVKFADLVELSAPLRSTFRGPLGGPLNRVAKALDDKAESPSANSQAVQLGTVRDSISAVALRALARIRSAIFLGESFMLPLIELGVHRKRPQTPFDDPKLFASIRTSLNELLEADIERIEAGVYPPQVLEVESPWSHVQRLPKLFVEGVRASIRRREKRSREFGPQAKSLLRGLPEYYQRNFHFQGDGYLSDQSAAIYEHQVEVLFGGAADAMRRLIIEPMRRHFDSKDGEGLRFLELGAGTGRTTQFVRLAFPKAKIVALDLSSPYLKRAQKQLARFELVDFVQGDAAATVFRDSEFDAVYSVFLFHELPEKVRVSVLNESHRLLKSNGFFGFVDSAQLGDRPDFDTALLTFPQQYHEPFYRNYVETPMVPLLKTAGFELVQDQLGFFSKMIAARKI